MALIWRFFVIAFAYGVASLAAGLTVMLGTFASGGMDASGDTYALPMLWAFTFATGGAVAFLAFAPAAIVIVLAEGFSWRSVLLYALVGGAVGVAYGVMLPGDEPGYLFPDRVPEVLAGAGIAAGLVYWLIAGRNAGKWREIAPPATPPKPAAPPAPATPASGNPQT